jgi:hypothetical protein
VHIGTGTQVRDNEKKRVLIVAEARLGAVPGAVPKPKKGAKKVRRLLGHSPSRLQIEGRRLMAVADRGLLS